MNFQKWGINKIKEKGYKKTKTRNKVIEEISKECKMFSASDLINNLGDLDRVSIYRAIELLEELDVIHKTVKRNGEQMYELHEPNDHHHHAICNKCDQQKCLECPIKEEQEPDLNNIHHSIFYSFTCSNCN